MFEIVKEFSRAFVRPEFDQVGEKAGNNSGNNRYYGYGINSEDNCYYPADDRNGGDSILGSKIKIRTAEIKNQIK